MVNIMGCCEFHVSYVHLTPYPLLIGMMHLVAFDGFMVSTQVCQSEGSVFKSRSGQIAYFHGVKTRLIIDRLKRLESPLAVYFWN